MYDDRNGLNNYQGFTPNEQNYNQPMSIIGANYMTPWDFNTLPTVNHYFEYLGRSYGKGYIRVTPYIGLAYYDGTDDGVYNTPIGSFNLASGGATPIGYQDQPFRGDLYVINGFREIVVDMSTTPSSGLNMHINNFPTQPYTDSFGKDWLFDTNFLGRISGLSMYIY